MKLGAGVPFFLFTTSVMAGFYVCNWEEYHTGVLQTNFNGVGVTESEVILITLSSLQGLTKGGFS